MDTRKQLIGLLKENGIIGCCQFKHANLVEMVNDKGRVPAKPFPRSKGPRSNPRSCIIKNIETGKDIEFPSMWQARKNYKYSTTYLGNLSKVTTYNGHEISVAPSTIKK